MMRREKLVPTFVVHAQNTPEVLAHVVLLLHGRRVPIGSLNVDFDDQTDLLRLESEIEDEGRAQFIETNLCELSGMVLVEKKTVDGDMKFHARREEQRER